MKIGVGISPYFFVRRGSPYNQYVSDWKTRVEFEGGSLTLTELMAANTMTESFDFSTQKRFWVHGLQNQIAARVSIANALTAPLLTEVNSPDWDAGFGYMGDGATSYLDLNYDASVGPDALSQDDAMMFCYSLTDQQDAGIDMGRQDASNKLRLTLRNTSDQVAYPVNESTGVGVVPGPNSESLGLFVGERHDNISAYVVINGASNVGDMVASSGLPSGNNYLCCLNSSIGALLFTTRRYAACGFGNSIGVDQTDFYNAIQTMGTTLGWAV